MDYLIFITWPHAESFPDAFHEGQGGYACVGHVPTNNGITTTMCVYNCTLDMLDSPNICVVGELKGAVDEDGLKVIPVSQEKQDWIRAELVRNGVNQSAVDNMDLSTVFDVVTRTAVFFGFPPGQAISELTGVET